MIEEDNKYTKMQKEFYEHLAEGMNMMEGKVGQGGHPDHNRNTDYWNILLGDIKNCSDDRWLRKNALDFGCGCGRNVINLLNLNQWNIVTGVDISENNINYCRENILNLFGTSEHSEFIVNNGIDLNEVKSNFYDFVMSTICIQHICVYDIRFSILKDFYRILKDGGLLSFQLGYDRLNCEGGELTQEIKDRLGIKEYYDNYYDAESTNSNNDFTLPNFELIEKDLIDIGFKKENISYKIKPSWTDIHYEWIYIKAIK